MGAHARPLLGAMMQRQADGLAVCERVFIYLLVLTLLAFVALHITYLPVTHDIAPPFWGTRTFITARHRQRRLGNLLFIYAAVFGVARMHNMTVTFDQDLALRDTFQLHAYFQNRDRDDMQYFNDYSEYGRRACAYDVGVEKLEHRHTILHGYFQSWKYFRFVEPELRQSLLFQPGHKRAAVEFLHQNAPTDWPAGGFRRVAIHVRRGDILGENQRRYGYTIATVEYFRQAMEFFAKKHPRVQFIVCSNDIAWCEANIHGSNVVYSRGHNEGTDLAILSLCDDTIMSTGSFSWWAAWLANGTTVYYDDWPAPASMLDYVTTKVDYFPSHWISMSPSRTKALHGKKAHRRKEQ